MSEKPDGGAAFPVSAEPWNVGMTLRDYFAGQVLNGLARNITLDQVSDFINGRLTGDSRAMAAYVLADAMLAEREK